MSKISIIICSRNRSKYLNQTLQKLPVSSFIKHSIELILVDNDSIDGSLELMKNYAEMASFSVKYICEKKEGLSFARNRGIALAKGDLLVFTDDDCYLQENYIEQLLEHFKTEKFQFCGGRILLWDKTGAMESMNYNDIFQLFPARSFIPAGDIQGANMVIHRSVFEKIGGFNT